MSKEEWRDIKNYEGKYQVSNLGRVRSLDRFVNSINGKRKVKGQIMSFTTRSGYNVLVLRKNNMRKSKQVHRLVAEAFIPNINNKPFVNHKDFNRKNNNVDNLEWVTQKENVHWSICNMKNKNKIFKDKEHYGIRYRNKYDYYEVTLKKKYYGSYKDFEEAKKVRDNKLKELGIVL